MIANGIGMMVAVVFAMLSANFLLVHSPRSMARFGYGLGGLAILTIGLVFTGFFEAVGQRVP